MKDWLKKVPYTDLVNYFQRVGWLHMLLIMGLYVFYKSLFSQRLPVTLVHSMIPLLIVVGLLILRFSKYGLYTLFSFQFLLILSGMFIDIKTGVATLVFTLFTLALLLPWATYERIDWKPVKNGMLYIYLVWGIFCLIELVNMNNVQEAWNIAITHYWLYPIACAILVPLSVRNIKGIYILLFIWSVFILIAAAKGYWQKTHGFNYRELYFLYVLGGYRTHLIWSGIRYFSCFSDAGNFGVHMAMAITTFGVSSFFAKNIWIKLYFIAVTLAAIYGMGISGTRSAIVLPIGGILLYILLSHNLKAVGIGLTVLAILVVFFRFTTIGESNEYIRKMRSAFRPSEDASFLLRVENRAKMKELIFERPLGYGLGLSKGERFYPKELMPYPPDSWLVSVWIETGTFGLILYLCLHALLFAWCSWILMFRIRNKHLRGLLTAWLCMNAGFFVAAYSNDVMQYPNSLVIYTGFALCFAGYYIEKNTPKQQINKR